MSLCCKKPASAHAKQAWLPLGFAEPTHSVWLQSLQVVYTMC